MYCMEYEQAAKTLGDVRKKNEKFNWFLELNEACEGMDLQSYLIQPVQVSDKLEFLLSSSKQ